MKCAKPYLGDEDWMAHCERHAGHLEPVHQGPAWTSEPIGVKVAEGVFMSPGSPTSGNYRTIQLGTKRWNDNQEVTQ